MGESITEAKVSKWRKAVGDAVQKDEIILEISTDKVDSEIPAPATGVITQLIAQEGDTVAVKSVIALIDTEASAGASPKAVPTSEAKSAPIIEVVEDDSDGRFYSPLVRSLAEKHGISQAELDTLKGSGQAGRVNKEDLLAFIESKKSVRPAPSMSVSLSVESRPSNSPAVQASTARPKTEGVPSLEWQPDGTKIVPMDNMRQAIADHMVRSKHTSPHVYSVQEVDCTNISKWRAKYKAEFQKAEGFGLSFTPFFLEATVKALQQFPYVNASVDGKKIVLKKNVNLGCAVALGNSGLIVPVIKRAEERNLVGIARALNDLAARARNKKLSPDDVMGGTFTVTNPGVFGTIIGTPIINQPQVAILCLGAIVKRPVVIDDAIAIREMCYLTLSYDHRIIDGSLGGQFLAAIRTYLEGWDMDRTL